MDTDDDAHKQALRRGGISGDTSGAKHRRIALYNSRAQEARDLASKAAVPEVRDQLLAIAAQWENLSLFLEATLDDT